MNVDNSLLITYRNNLRMLRIYGNASIGVQVTPNNSNLISRRAIFDDRLLNLFVIDGDSCLMTKYHNGPMGATKVFGSTCGSNLSQIATSASFCMDSMGNFYMADNNNRRILFWAVNATKGVLLAGVTGVPGNDSLHLNHPEDVVLDETEGMLYAADTYNDRIIRYSLTSRNGTVVAGGYGPSVQPK